LGGADPNTAGIGATTPRLRRGGYSMIAFEEN
jgi:hypothetical protein